ncbi:MAG: carboxylesterase [Burkholderiaceae bacterium]|nr:MAG: carboxylesterase [Burkholderiaceae bacterium]
MTTELECVELQSRATPQASIIWLHGLGADGHDFVPIVRELDLEKILPLRFVFPHAPVIPVTINSGYPMRAWYDIRTPDFAQREDEAGVRASQAAIEQLIQRENERGIPSERIVLAGFSQGGAITLHTGLRYPHKLAGLLALSTYLPVHEAVASERHSANQDTPIFMAHGTQDTIVQFAWGQQTRARLEEMGYRVEWHEYPMQHSVCADEVNDIGQWLQRILPS